MATIPFSTDADRGEARFFFIMACLMATVILAGFSFNIVTGRSSFGMPWLVHFHAWAMMSWVGLYLVQNWLFFSGNVALHRRLGWLSVILVPVIVVMGFVVTAWSVRAAGGPPFFAQNEFLFGNPTELATVGAVVAWAVTVRRNTGWHRRLMFCAFAILTGPGLGRLLPMILFEPYSWAVTVGITLIFPLIGMAADKRRYGRAHPAWLWGMGALLTVQVAAMAVAYSPFGKQFTREFVAGTSGGERPLEAFVPPA